MLLGIHWPPEPPAELVTMQVLIQEAFTSGRGFAFLAWPDCPGRGSTLRTTSPQGKKENGFFFFLSKVEESGIWNPAW